MVKNRRLVIIIIVLLVGTASLLFTSVPTIPGKYFDRPLPDELDRWQALEVYTCPRCMEIIETEASEKKLEHDPNTGFFFIATEPRVAEGKCPFHNIDISASKTTEIPTSPVVYNYLPEDTEYQNRFYNNGELLINPETQTLYLAPDKHLIQVTTVTSGKDKRSIHRAERCLQSQGHQLKRHKRIWLPVPDSKRKKLDVTVIQLLRATADKRNERSVALYFYAGGDHITANNFKRLALMAWDRMILGKNYRWSYILMTSRVQKSYRKTEDTMLQFVSEFFPRVEK